MRNEWAAEKKRRARPPQLSRRRRRVIVVLLPRPAARGGTPMRLLLIVPSVIFSCLMASCRSSVAPATEGEDVEALAARIRFERTHEPQDAVFLTQQAPFVGGPAAGAV